MSNVAQTHTGEHDEHIIQNCWPVKSLKPGPINTLTPVQSDFKEKRDKAAHL